MKKKGFLLGLLLLLVGTSFLFIPPKKLSSTKLPVIFTIVRHTPLMVSRIENKNYLLLIDLGSCTDMSLNTKTLENIEKIKSRNTIGTYDFKGNTYDSETYYIPKVHIGPFSLTNFEVKEQSPDFHMNTGYWEAKRNIDKTGYHGSVGWEFFANYCTLIDFPNSSIHTAKNIEELKADGLMKMEQYLSVQFDVQQGVLVIPIETDLGVQKVILDTGTSFCTLRLNAVSPERRTALSPEHSYFKSSKLIIGGCNFSSWNFGLLEFSDVIKADGVIGADFFLEHAVCLDFANQMAYIKKPESVLATQWKRSKYHLTQFFFRHFSKLPKIEAL